MEINDVTGEIVRGAMRVHSEMGPGLMESVYRTCLCHELLKRGLQVNPEKPIQINYDGMTISAGLRIDLLVEDSVVVELKSVERMLPLHQSQLLSYWKLTGIKTGLLINFNVRHLRHGIKRMVR